MSQPVGTTDSRHPVSILSSVGALHDSSSLWNKLWERSANARPTSRAEPIAHWVDHFTSTKELRAVVVEASPSAAPSPTTEAPFLAAMPLVPQPMPLGLRLGSNPFNHWASAGELLVDPSAGRVVIDRLAEGLRDLGWPLLMLRGIPLSSPTYQQFEASCQDQGMATYRHVTHEVGVVELGRDYEAFMAGRSKNHRGHMRKAARRAAREGGVSLRIVRAGSPQELAAEVRAGFSVEHNGWKGQAGSSVLDIKGLSGFFEKQAELLADAGALHLVFLEHRGQPIAFEFGYLGDGTYFTPKVGYDEGFASLSPGQLLRAELFESFCSVSSPQRIDFAGPLADATARWSTSTYPVGNLVIALDRLRGTPLVWAYRGYQLYKDWRRRAGEHRDTPLRRAAALDTR